ncbi:MAG: alkaline phosphatase family protein [bacterium]
MRKAIILGLDGASLDVLVPLAKQGYLPNIASLMENGVWGVLTTVIPPGTAPAWTSIITGLDPSNHGVFDLIVRAKDSYSLAFHNRRSIKARFAWDLIGEQGGKVLVLNVPMTYPPSPLNGLLVCGFLTPPSAEEKSYPRGLFDEILSIAPGYKIVPSQTPREGRITSFLNEIHDVLDIKLDVFRNLLRRDDWAFVMQVISETDFLQHGIWHLLDPTHPYYDQAEAEKHRPKIIEIYQVIDRLIGELSQSEDHSLFIVSDHGHGPLTEFIHLNNLLLKASLMKVKHNPISWLRYLLFRAGFTPLNVYRLVSLLGIDRYFKKVRWTEAGYSQLKSMFFSFGDIDWRRTKAYAISGGLFGQLYINLKGRERCGVVDLEDYERARAEVASTLLGFSVPKRGTIFAKWIKREEIYKGRNFSEAPDFFILPSDPKIGIFGDFEFSSNKLIERAPRGISSQHRMEGVFMAKSPILKKGLRFDKVEAVDVTPMVLYSMGLAIPKGLDGKIHKEIIQDDYLKANPPIYSESQVKTDSESSLSDDENLKRMLKGLGYIS